MRLVCCECKNVIEIEGPLEDQQLVKCPHCGVMTEYSKPVRIELPAGYRERSADGSVKERSGCSESHNSPKSKLHAIHSDSSSLLHDSAMAANYALRGVSARLEEAKKYKEQEDTLSRQIHRRNIISNLITVFLGFAIIGGLWFGYQKWTDNKHREAEEYNRILEERNREAERYEAEQQMRREERRLAEERQRAEREAQREKERLEEEVRQEKLRAERLVRIEKERVEREREESERATVMESYKMYIEALRSNEFDLFIQSLEATVIKSAGTMCYCLPSEEGINIPLYQVSYETNGLMSVSRIFKTGEKEMLDVNVFKQRISGTDSMVVYGSKVYFRANRKIRVSEFCRKIWDVILLKYFLEIWPILLMR